MAGFFLTLLTWDRNLAAYRPYEFFLLLVGPLLVGHRFKHSQAGVGCIYTTVVSQLLSHLLSSNWQTLKQGRKSLQRLLKPAIGIEWEFDFLTSSTQKRGEVQEGRGLGIQGLSKRLIIRSPFKFNNMWEQPWKLYINLWCDFYNLFYNLHM